MHQPPSLHSISIPRLHFSPQTRLLVVAPHPDDESLACGVALQAAARAGAAVQVVYATDGDNNPWPQRFIERKWRITETDRLRWGKSRRKEAEEALITLGLRREDACFLGFPDQGLTDLLMYDTAAVLSILGKVIDDFRPTDLIYPSTADAHPDHNALAVILLTLLRQLPRESTPAGWQFAVHGHNPFFFANAQSTAASSSEIALKRKAIECHRTQLRLSRRRFLRYAERPEKFLLANGPAEPAPQVGPAIISRDARHLTIGLPRQKNPFDQEPSLLAVGCSEHGQPATAVFRLSASGAEMMSSSLNDSVFLPILGNRREGAQITLPVEDIFSPEHPIFLKVNRRSMIFADAGWCEVPALETKVTRTELADPDVALMNA